MKKGRTAFLKKRSKERLSILAVAFPHGFGVVRKQELLS
jgi:hypothetical protein